jgi:hypothetical protein
VTTVKLLLRDDDTNYFTSVDELREVYESIWDVAPVALAVVPFQTGCRSGAIPGDVRSSEEMYPVGENEELVEFLRPQIDRGRVSIMLHGYSHEDFTDGYEFEACPNPYRRVCAGKEYLEDVFDTTVNTFVPPHNSLSREGTAAVAEVGLNILTAFGHWPRERPRSAHNYYNFLKLVAFRLRHGKSKRYPCALDFPNHSELPCYSLVRDIPTESVRDGLSFTFESGGDASIAYHYWELLKYGLLDDLHNIVKEWSSREGVEFVTDKEMFR